MPNAPPPPPKMPAQPPRHSHMEPKPPGTPDGGSPRCHAGRRGQGRGTEGDTDPLPGSGPAWVFGAGCDREVTERWPRRDGDRRVCGDPVVTPSPRQCQDHGWDGQTLLDRGTRVGQQVGGGHGAAKPPYVWVGALGNGGEGEVVVVQLGRGAVSAGGGEERMGVRLGTLPSTPRTPRPRFGVNPVLGGGKRSQHWRSGG